MKLQFGITLAVLGCLFALGCNQSTSSQANAADSEKHAHGEAEIVDVAQTEALLKAGGVAVDANSKRTRKKYGTIPNAKILSSSYKYPLSELPSDKSQELVFYCSNTRCTASDAAAHRALENGYKEVNILRVGIKGWKDAGKKTQSYSDS